MASYVLVPGGGHGGWCYQPVARRLQAAGHGVYPLTLTGVGERSHLLSPDIDLDTHIDTGHDLMITEPGAVTEALLEIAAS